MKLRWLIKSYAFGETQVLQYWDDDFGWVDVEIKREAEEGASHG